MPAADKQAQQVTTRFIQRKPYLVRVSPVSEKNDFFQIFCLRHRFSRASASSEKCRGVVLFEASEPER